MRAPCLAYAVRHPSEGTIQRILPLLTADDEASLRSTEQIKAFREDEPEVTIVPTHDPSAWHALRPLSASAEQALVAAS